MSQPRPEQYTGTVTAGPGGAMTDDVGVITGDLTLTTTLQTNGQAQIRIQYTGADEWYTLTGSPTAVPDQDVEALHTAVLDAIARGGEATVPR
ncbi:hypothetical protein ACIQJX_26860 [Streptomyces griseoviridis]